jgi:rubredoxin
MPIKRKRNKRKAVPPESGGETRSIAVIIPALPENARCPVCNHGELVRVRLFRLRRDERKDRLHKSWRGSPAVPASKLSKKTFLECASCGHVFTEGENAQPGEMVR